jgi:hypothetical protein
LSTIDEIKALEERLRLAELGPDPAFFEAHLADDAILDGQRAKARVVAAHQPGSSAKFTKVEMSDLDIIDHGNAAVVLCKGYFEGPKGAFSLKFMRVWVKKSSGWQIVAGAVGQ